MGIFLQHCAVLLLFLVRGLRSFSLSSFRISPIPAMCLYWSSLHQRFYNFRFPVLPLPSSLLTLSWKALKLLPSCHEAITTLVPILFIPSFLLLIRTKSPSYQRLLFCSESHLCFSSLLLTLISIDCFPSGQKCALLSLIPNPALISELFPASTLFLYFLLSFSFLKLYTYFFFLLSWVPFIVVHCMTFDTATSLKLLLRFGCIHVVTYNWNKFFFFFFFWRIFFSFLF